MGPAHRFESQIPQIGDFQPSVVQLLAAPSTPDDAIGYRVLTIRRAPQGTRRSISSISCSKVDRLVSRPITRPNWKYGASLFASGHSSSWCGSLSPHDSQPFLLSHGGSLPLLTQPTATIFLSVISTSKTGPSWIPRIFPTSEMSRCTIQTADKLSAPYAMLTYGSTRMYPGYPLSMSSWTAD